jgi:hypothetical protein
MFSCTFAVIKILDNIGSLPFISWAISMKLSDYYFCHVPSFVEKYPKIKSAISERPIWQQLALSETSFLLLLKPKIRFKKHQTFSQSAHGQPSLCFRYATELKKWDLATLLNTNYRQISQCDLPENNTISGICVSSNLENSNSN